MIWVTGYLDPTQAPNQLNGTLGVEFGLLPTPSRP